MESNDVKEVIGYCKYCKDEIYDDEAHVVCGQDKYHIHCHKLLIQDEE